MSLLNYYKKHIFEFGYNVAFNTRNKDIKQSQAEKEKTLDGIYFNDEMDYYICADYYGSFVGSVNDWAQEDIEFLHGLGFSPLDFEGETGNE